MANISDKVAQIRQAVYGKDVRESIASGIESINSEVETTTAKQAQLETTFEQLIISAGNSNAEIVDARGGFDTLRKKLDSYAINVKDFGAKGDGVTDDTAAIQAALNYAASLYGGDISSDAGYIGWYTPEVLFPRGVYLCGQVTLPGRIKLTGAGQAVIKSKTGTANNPSGYFVNNQVINLYVRRLTFLYFDICFRIPTGNVDFSFITFEECQVAKTNLFVDTVGFDESRSTTFKMVRCNVSYGVPTLCKIYTDKAYFEGNWFNHSDNSIFMYIDSYATFRDNVWVPTNPGPNKAYISFSGADATRSLLFENERFGGESGQCPIVIANNVNLGNANERYRQQGITFINCKLFSNSTYDPDGVGGVRACVILRPTLSPQNSINYIRFIGCSFAPDLNGGIVQSYNTPNIKDLLPQDFVIEFDYTSAVSATKGVNKLSSADLTQYVYTPILSRKTFAHSKGSGKLSVVDSSTNGQKKATFQIDLTWPNNYLPPFAYLVITAGQGDARYDSSGYAYTSVYILTISGGYQAGGAKSKISYTKIYGNTGGMDFQANADIISIHWGTADTGSTEFVLQSGVSSIQNITIVFGTNMQKGYVYVKPLFDFSLLT